MIRTISQTEVARALDCQAAHAFRYTGHLTGGDALRPKQIAPLLQSGRAWGAAMAAYHSQGFDVQAALGAATISLDRDAEAQREAGVFLREPYDLLVERLRGLLLHHHSYASRGSRFEISPDVEHELNVPIPSRGGSGRASSRYRFEAYVDAYSVEEGGVWLWEFKLRTNLQPVAQIQLSRQLRWYAWAWGRSRGVEVEGVRVHERWNEVPKPPRMVKSKKKSDPDFVPSHAKDQLCTPESYRAVCAEHGIPFDELTYDALASRRWEQLVPIQFRQGELEEAGQELISAARLIGDLDAGHSLPLRNAGHRCRWCEFSEICPAPDDRLVDTLFDRTPPKRRKDRDARNGDRP